MVDQYEVQRPLMTNCLYGRRDFSRHQTTFTTKKNLTKYKLWFNEHSRLVYHGSPKFMVDALKSMTELAFMVDAI